jgi:hypothetical protein
MLTTAANWAGVDMLEWLQHNSGEPWTDADKAAMLLVAGRRFQLTALKWVRERGAAWPASFIGSISFRYTPYIKICWTVPAMKWALASGCAWGDWQCQQLAPELYTDNCHQGVCMGT